MSKSQSTNSQAKQGHRVTSVQNRSRCPDSDCDPEMDATHKPQASKRRPEASGTPLAGGAKMTHRLKRLANSGVNEDYN